MIEIVEKDDKFIVVAKDGSREYGRYDSFTEAKQRFEWVESLIKIGAMWGNIVATALPSVEQFSDADVQKTISVEQATTIIEKNTIGIIEDKGLV